MDKSKIVLRLQQIASSSSDPYELMVLAKAAEKLRAGSVTVVSTTASLPAAATSTVGEIFLVENDDDLYVNVGSQWNSLNNEISGFLSYAWGQGNLSQLGDGTTNAKSSPVTVVGGITWSRVAAGASHGLGVAVTGIAYAWGYGGQGRLGDNTTTNRSSPVTVVGGITTWSQVSAGYRHSLGVTSAGIAYAWGYNGSGRLGDNTTTNRSSPVTVVGGITNWTQVAAGTSHSLGVTATGIAYGWGNNQFGAIGDNSSTTRTSPVTVVGGITNWSQVAEGGFDGSLFSLGVTSTGIAYAWGYNGNGKLGDGTTTSRLSPVVVVGGITNWSQVAGGVNHSLGLTGSGIAYAWGGNNVGQLGDGTTTNRSSPVTVISGITNWSQVAAGGVHSLGVTSTGIAYAWGNAADGRLGDGTTVSKSSPVTVLGGITNWSQLSAGAAHSLGLRSILKSI
jgi:alpha-tubulin suppressor-like RCC1 family protein